MKRILALITGIILLASLSACAKDNSKNENSDQNQESTATQTVEEVTVPAWYFDFGSYYGNSYNNNSLSIGISIPDEWKVLSTSELAEKNNMNEQEMLTDFATQMDGRQTAYLVSAEDETGASTLTLTVDNLLLAGNANITGTEYFKLTKDATTAEIEATGGTNIYIKDTSVTIGYRTYASQILAYYLGDEFIYQERIAMPAGNFMALVTLSGDTEIILNRIYPLA